MATGYPSYINHVVLLDDGLKYKICDNKNCRFGGAFQPVSNFYCYEYRRATIYSSHCLDCREKTKNGWKERRRIPDAHIPPNVELVRGNVGANFGIEHPYREGKTSALLQRFVHFVDYKMDNDIIITVCGRIFDDGAFDTTSDLLHYGKLCSTCLRKYYDNTGKAKEPNVSARRN